MPLRKEAEGIRVPSLAAAHGLVQEEHSPLGCPPPSHNTMQVEGIPFHPGAGLASTRLVDPAPPERMIVRIFTSPYNASRGY